MLIIGLVFAVLAALLHIFIFFLESLAWTTPRARAVFGTTPEEARATAAMAFNQGFYNLFLALVTATGVAFVAAGVSDIGAALILAGVGSMAAAALVLFASSPDQRGAALKQGVLPLLSVIFTVIGVLS